MTGIFYAHTKPGRPEEEWEPLEEHLRLVRDRAVTCARAFGAEWDAEVSALLHDLGKCSELFQRRLRGKESGLDHWTPGALAACNLYRAAAANAALAILGHHAGLPDKPLGEVLDAAVRNGTAHPGGTGLRITIPATRALDEVREALRSLEVRGISLPKSRPVNSFDRQVPHIGRMLDTRMLFSTLVDADFIETEAWFDGEEPQQRRYRETGPELQAEAALPVLLGHIRELEAKAASEESASPEVLRVRSELLRACLFAAESPTGLFNLTAPTGSGKTLAMMAFALAHAERHKLNRVIVVIPFLSIIEQTARILRKIFEPAFGPHYVLEHHSLAGTRERSNAPADSEEEERRTRDKLAENWDAPLVVTTSVQALECLFAHRPGPCRKLHRLANSVILFDEVQTLPGKWVIPSLASLTHLAARYRATIVFSTATQPAFSHLSAKVKTLGGKPWEPIEIVTSAPAMFKTLRRVRIDVSNLGSDRQHSWDEVSAVLAAPECRQVLCIVNLKRHAVRLFELLRGVHDDGVLHLSTSMCPQHRRVVLDQVKDRLAHKQPCRLISTQCVEAGVDVDFPIVWRALGPLEAVIQAAGRCNRNGKQDFGHVRIFQPVQEEDERSIYPPGYGDAAAEAASILRDHDELDTADLELIRRYYANLYDAGKAEMSSQSRDGEKFADALTREAFAKVSSMFHLIDNDSINVLVPYDGDAFSRLRGEALGRGTITREWVAAARPHTVGVFVSGKDRERLQPFLCPFPLHRKASAAEDPDWWYLTDSGEPPYYDPDLGLKAPPEMPFLNS